MTKCCGCCPRRKAPLPSQTAGTTKESTVGTSGPNIRPSTVLLAPDLGDVLAQTIEVTQAALAQRQSSLQRILTQKNIDPDKTGEPSVAVTNAALAELMAEDNLSSKTEETPEIASDAIAHTETPASPANSPQPEAARTSANISKSPPAEQLSGKPDSGSAAIVDQPILQPESTNDSDIPKSTIDVSSVVACLNAQDKLMESQKPQNFTSQSEIKKPTPTPQELLHIARRKFFKQWLEILRSCQQDIDLWVNEEALLKAHLLCRLVRIDCERAKAYLEGSDQALDEIAASNSCILPVDGNLPFLESILPAEVIVEIGGGADILADVRQHTSEPDLNKLKNSVQTLIEHCHDTDMQYLDDKWTNFGEIMNIFNLSERVSFDLIAISLMSDRTNELWMDTIKIYGGDCTGSEPLRVQSTAPPGPIIDYKKRGFRRSVSRGVKKMGRKVKYRKRKDNTGQVEEPWVCDEKPQLSLAYRLHSDGNVSVKVRCKLPVNFMNMLIVLDDIQGFKTWLPYCTDVKLIKTYGTASYLLSYIAEMPWPIKKRETLAFCEGVDALDELGQLVVVVRNPPLAAGQDTIFGDELPPPEPKIPRIPKCALVFFVRPIVDEVTAVELFARLDPGMNVKLLKGIIPWIVKNTVVDFMVKIANLAHNLNVNEKIEAADRDFYRNIRDRGEEFIARTAPDLKDVEPLSEKQRRAIGFDDKDDKC